MDIRVASYVVLERAGSVLLSHWFVDADHQGWTMPGGGIDPGEHPADAAVREVKEETGYDVELGHLLGIGSIVVPGASRLTRGRVGVPMQGIRVVYSGRITGGVLRAETDGSSDDAAWIPLTDVPLIRRVSLVDEALAFAGLL